MIDEKCRQADWEHGGWEEEEEDVELCLSVREFVLKINNNRTSAQLEHAARFHSENFYYNSRSRYNTPTAAPLAGYRRLIPGILSVGNVLYLRPSEEDQISECDY